jgi:hypothetical protein
MGDYIEIIKHQFFSNENIEFIIKVANNRNINITTNHIPFNACNKIFNTFIHTIYSQKKSIKPEAIEELLITLNKMTIDLIIEESQQSVPQQSVPQQSVPQQSVPLLQQSVSQPYQESVSQPYQESVSQPYQDYQGQNESSVIIDNENDIKKVVDNTKIEHLYLFSEDSEFKGGEYKFEFRKQHIKKLSLKSFELMNNLYNITESNNMIEISEKNIKKIINIPIGCYLINDLITNIDKQLEDKYKDSNIKMNYNKHKNQISIKGDSPFSFGFIENNNLFVPLRFMLGFDKKDYVNNTTYLSTNQPVINIYDSIYIKITNPEYNSIFNTKWSKNFNFYDHISFKQLETFSQDVTIPMNNTIELNDNIDDINIELYYRHINHKKFYKINTCIKFLMIFQLEIAKDLKDL